MANPAPIPNKLAEALRARLNSAQSLKVSISPNVVTVEKAIPGASTTDRDIRDPKRWTCVGCNRQCDGTRDTCPFCGQGVRLVVDVAPAPVVTAPVAEALRARLTSGKTTLAIPPASLAVKAVAQKVDEQVSAMVASATVVTALPENVAKIAAERAQLVRERALKIAERNRVRAIVGPPENTCAGCKAPCGESVLCSECANAGKVDTSLAATPGKDIPGNARERLMALTAAYLNVEARGIPESERSAAVMRFAKCWLASESSTRRAMCLEV